MNPESIHDLIIIGGGPAGLTAGLYASRARLDTLLIERGLFGGQMANAELIENFPGFPEGINGYDLAQLMQRQAEKYGLKIVTDEVTRLTVHEGSTVVLTGGDGFHARTVIIAAGSERQKLGAPGEIEFAGKGVSYCATCDAPFFSGQVVAVVGGGDAALSEALHLAKVASRVVVIHRRKELRATRILQERAFQEPKIEFSWNNTVERIEGGDFVKQILLRNVETGKQSVLEVSGVFVSVGFRPQTDYLKGVVPIDEIGHVLTNERMETSVPGILAAGDVRHNSARQAIAAAGDGASAAISAQRFLEHS